jgi:putative flippase GtrA
VTTARQLGVFAAVGISSNAMLYALYLVLTEAGAGHKAAMTAAFSAGVAMGYMLNRRWTFRHTGAARDSAMRYLVSYALAYIANVCAMVLLVDIAELPHQAVMLGLIVVTAAFTFVLQKHWVFEPIDRLVAGKEASR